MNKKGFVLTETIIVSVFIVTIFTFVFASVFPLIGKYEDLAEREENIDILYKLYNIRKLINNDTLKTDLLNMDIKRLTCSDFDYEEECETLMEYLDLSSYILVYANGIADNYDIIGNMDSEIAEYIKEFKTENRKTLILLDNTTYTIGHIDMHDNNTNAYYTIKNNILKSDCTSTTTENDVIYLSGDNECVNYNYVWYSGKMWRVTAIYPDTTIKMITENSITSIPFGNNNVFYTNENKKSYAYQWLNEDFLDTLTNYRNLLELSTDNSKKWNAATPSGTTLSGTNYVTAYVGLMNNHEYYLSYKNATNEAAGYLNFTDGMQKPVWYKLHPTPTSEEQNTWGQGIRPMIYLKTNVNFSSGVGTFDNPFTILGDLPRGKANERINTRMSGEYVKLSSQDSAPTYRIVSIDENGGNKITKLIANYYTPTITASISNGATFGSSITNSGYIDGYLNTTFYNNLVSTNGSNFFTTGTYYLGNSNSSVCYKDAVCITCDSTIKVANCTKSPKQTFNVGIARFGEMFATSMATYDLKKIGKNYQDIWLITSYDTTNKYRFIDASGYAPGGTPFPGTNTSKKLVRATIHLKTPVVIVSGNGTPTDPYVLSP